MSLELLTISFDDHNANKDFERSLKHSGFAVIKDHRISPKLIDSVYSEWQDFFNNPKKNDFIFDAIKQDGFFPYLTENAKGSTIKDLKEFFHVFSWGRLPDSVGPSTIELFQQLTDLGATLLSWLQDCSPQHIQNRFSIPLKETIKDSQSNLLRIIHYPPISGDEEANSIRAAAHEDINLLTMLVAGTQPGLQVLDNNNTWHDVSCDQNTIVVNSGDMLKMISGEYYPSTTHRVINPDISANHSRYSMPLFLHPRDNVKLNTNYSAGSYLKERLEEIGLIQ
jgi:isopenicillin N synthase-like dioxygenase